MEKDPCLRLSLAPLYKLVDTCEKFKKGRGQMTLPASLDPVTITIFFTTIGFASLVHGAIGIGFPLIATPVLAMITDVRTAILILVLPTVLLNIISIFKGGRFHRSLAVYYPLALYGMIGSFIGTRLIVIFPAEIFRPILAGVMIVYLNAERLGIGLAWVKSHPKTGMVIFGTAAGLCGGMVNVMLPVLVIYALEVNLTKTAMIQVFNFCFLFGKLTQGGVFFQAGLITKDIILVSLPLAGWGLIISFAAFKLRNRINTDTYRRWLRLLIAIMAGVLLIQFFL